MFILRLIVISIFVLQFSTQSSAQSCCSPTASFASLADQEEFKSTHTEPLPYTGKKLSGESVEFPTPDSSPARAWIIPARKESKTWLLIFHEWWGLTDHVKEEAEIWADELKDVNVLCLDLYDGQSSLQREIAAQLMQSADEARIRQIIAGARQFIGFNSEVMTLGWCFGGGWSMQASIMFKTKAKACVFYYGMPETDPSKLEDLNADVLGIFASKDEWINAEVVSSFEMAMNKAEKSVEIVTFDAEHAFANPTNPQFNKSADKQAHDMAIKFLRSHLE